MKRTIITFAAIVTVSLGLAACGSADQQTDAGTVAGSDAKTVRKIEHGVKLCQRLHEGYASTALPGDDSYGRTSAVVTICKDGTVLAEDD